MGQNHVYEQRESTVVELHGDALERFHGGLDLEHAEDDRLVGAEHLARGDAEEERIADLPGRAGDGDLDGNPAHHGKS